MGKKLLLLFAFATLAAFFCLFILLLQLLPEEAMAVPEAQQIASASMGKFVQVAVPNPNSAHTQ